jgi:flagellar hook-basal body complex protein FliE
MSMMSISPLSSLPDLTMTPSIGAGAAPVASSGASFADALKQAMSSTVNTVAQGEAAALGGIQGTVPLQTVVERVMEAERTMQAAIAVRDKIVSAYLDISKMQI